MKLPTTRRGWPVPAPIMWYAAPDYIRLTAKGGRNAAVIERSYEWTCRTVADWLGENPANEVQWGANGYKGRAIGPVAWGTGHEGLCLQVSGPGAEKVRALNPPWDNVARLDVQVTLWYEDDWEGIARDVARKSDSAARAAHHRPWGVEHINGFGKGDTCYLGSRKSATYCRVYDKWRERGGAEEWRHAWRFEVELKEGTGAAYWTPADGTLPTSDYWAAAVVSIFANRGITMPPLVPGAVAAPARLPREKTTTDRRLRWLAKSVAPTIEKLQREGVPLAAIGAALTGSLDPAILASGVLN